MHQTYCASTGFGVRVRDMANWLFGCSHRRTTFPRTQQAGVSVDGLPRAQPEIYVVCLDCGRQFTYDWTTMRVTKAKLDGIHMQPLSGKTARKAPVMRSERVLPPIEGPQLSHEGVYTSAGSAPNVPAPAGE